MTKRKTSKKGDAAVAATVKQEGREFLKKENLRLIIGFIILLMAIYIAVAIVSFFVNGSLDQSLMDSAERSTRPVSNWAGNLGAWFSFTLVNNSFGIPSILIPVFMGVASLKLLKIGKIRLWKWFVNLSIITIWLSVALQFFIPDNLLNSMFFLPGGRHGQFVCDKLMTAIGKPGTVMLLAVTLLLYLIYLSDETLRIIKSWGKKLRPNNKKATDTPAVEDIREEVEEKQEPDVDSVIKDGEEPEEQPVMPVDDIPVAEKAEEPQDKKSETKEEVAKPNDSSAEAPAVDYYDPRKDLEYYKFPPISLLRHYDYDDKAVDGAEMHANEERIRETLRNFGVEISSISATVGPTVTLYEITPASGVRIAKIRSLEDDIALSLSAIGIRIIAPIPGKGTIGIEVPNRRPQIVSMESVINTDAFRNFKAELPVVIGKTITNEPFMFDLAKAPHLLVAGATGQGKSVGLNAIITSLLYRKHPAELKLVLIDPKKVEFSIYSPLENHFLAQVPDGKSEIIITETERVVYALTSLCKEMDTRYSLLKKARVRNIKEYNKRFCERRLSPENGHHYMPYIVVVVDEFGDLIMTAGKAIETPITRIAQLARAVGIHMIIATQRPTTNIITGTIKANFPARIAFKTSAAIDSRTILDRTGANRLIGRGDMLYLAGEEPVRVQCAFMDTPEVENLTNYIAKQQGYPEPFELPEVPMPESSSQGMSSDSSDEAIHLDPLFEEVAKAIVESGVGSTSFIQRRFSIGFTRAGRIMDQLEKMGIVGPPAGAKPREVLCSTVDEINSHIANAM